MLIILMWKQQQQAVLHMHQTWCFVKPNTVQMLQKNSRLCVSSLNTHIYIHVSLNNLCFSFQTQIAYSVFSVYTET